MTPISALAELLRSLEPVLNPGVYAFCAIASGEECHTVLPLATFREAEGVTAIVEVSIARAHGLRPIFEAAWITLTVNSDLQAVGLTAAVARALADAGIHTETRKHRNTELFGGRQDRSVFPCFRASVFP